MKVLENIIWFDGHTSKPWKGSLHFENGELTLALVHQDIQSKTWAFENLDWKNIKKLGNSLQVCFLNSSARLLLPLNDGLEFLKELGAQYPDYQGRWKKLEAIHSPTKPKTVIILAASVAAFLLIGYFVLVPLTADMLARNLPPELEKSLGTQVVRSVELSAPVDKQKTKNIQKFWEDLNYPGAEKVRVLVLKDSKTVNSFAVMGGTILVYQGILKHLHTSEELAALLAHEDTHLLHKHSARLIIRSQAGAFLVSFLADSATGFAGVFLQNLDELHTLGYSREMEKDADLNGVHLLYQRGLPPQGMLDLIRELKKAVPEDAKRQSLWDNHPSLQERERFISKEIDSLPKGQRMSEELNQDFELLKSDS